MEWIKVATGSDGLELLVKNDEFLINVNSYELMGTFCHKSEDALATLSRQYNVVSSPSIVIGGLGLGFTLAAFLKEFGDEAKISVVERSPDVMKWFETYTKRNSVGELDDSKINYICHDISTFNPEGPVDIIVLDVDNGPESICGGNNHTLYGLDGLKRVHSLLNPGGFLLLWSAFDSEAFVEVASTAGFSVTTEVIDLEKEGWTHFIFVCKKA